MAASTAQALPPRQERDQRRQRTSSSASWSIMKGYHKEYKPHLRMAAAKELIRQIEFDYDEEPTPQIPTESAPASEPVGASLVGAHAASEADQHQTNPVNPKHPVNPRRGSPLGNPDSDKITAHQPKSHKSQFRQPPTPSQSCTSHTSRKPSKRLAARQS